MAASTGRNVTSGEIRAVGWINREEWEYLYRSLYSDDAKLKKKALERVSAWRCRFVSKMPVAVDCTASLVNAVMQDEQNTTDLASLSSIYSMALIRFVNMITDKSQTKQYAIPVHTVADEIGIPEWLVNLRHSATHSELPSLRVLRTGVKYALLWLQLEYWEENSEVLANDDNDDDDIRDILVNYQHEQFKIMEAQKTGLQNIDRKPAKTALVAIKDVLRIKRRKCLIQTMLQDGFLVPSVEQLQSLKISEDDFVSDSGLLEIPTSFFNMWGPVLKLFQQLDYTQLLIQDLLTELCKFTNQDVFAARCLAGWVLSIVTAGQNKNDKSDITSDTTCNVNWKSIFDLCVENPGRGTIAILERIVSFMKPQISDTTRQGIKELTSIYLSSDKDEVDEQALPENRIYTMDDVHCQQDEDLGNQTIKSDSPEKTEDRGWQLCSDLVDWSMYPLGMVPNQPLEDPQHLELAISQENMKSIENDKQQCEMESEDETEPQERREEVAMVTDACGAVWSSSDVEIFKKSIGLF